jgi:hypothetical protein
VTYTPSAGQQPSNKELYQPILNNDTVNNGCCYAVAVSRNKRMVFHVWPK